MKKKFLALVIFGAMTFSVYGFGLQIGPAAEKSSDMIDQVIGGGDIDIEGSLGEGVIYGVVAKAKLGFIRGVGSAFFGEGIMEASLTPGIGLGLGPVDIQILTGPHYIKIAEGSFESGGWASIIGVDLTFGKIVLNPYGKIVLKNKLGDTSLIEAIMKIVSGEMNPADAVGTRLFVGASVMYRF